MFYRIKNNGVITGYQTHDKKLDYDYLEEISEDEYNTAIAELQAKAEAEAVESELTKDERIAELESENAALLYQMLTGEELADV